jgi:hypothetical protein
VERALAKVQRRAVELVAAKQNFHAAVREAHTRGASVRTIEAAAREAIGPRPRGFTRERIRVIIRQGGEQPRRRA